MFNIFIFLSIVFLFVFLVGSLFEKVKIPWIFSALLLGVMLAFYNPFVSNTSSPEFSLLANLGMYFLLFVIGFEIDLTAVKGKGGLIFKTSLYTIFLNALLVGIAIKIMFASTWFISFLVGLSFSTVGEAILIPILEEFKMVKTKLGQTIIGVGTLDDVVEVLTLVAVISLLGAKVAKHFDVFFIIIALLSLMGLTYGLSKLKKQGNKFSVSSIEKLFLFCIFIFFLFLGIGGYAEAASLGAILAGVGLKTFLPKERLKGIENEIRAVCYGFFAPIFFLSAGLSMDMKYLINYYPAVIVVALISALAKYLGSIAAAEKELGLKRSILLGTGLLVRFSTSIVVIKILFENELINEELYSVIMATSIIFTILIPVVFSYLINKWKNELVEC